MLKLLINESSEGAPSRPRSLAESHVTAQRDRDGKVCAYTYTIDGEHHVDLPELASFSFTTVGREVNALPKVARNDWIVDAYRRTVLPLALQAQGQEVLHASAVVARGRVVGVCGKSGTGKSTVAFALASREYQLWADDALALSLAEDAVTALPLPFKIRLKGESALHFGARPAHDNGLAILEPDGPPLGPTPLGALVMLEREANLGGAGPVLRPLPPSEAFPALLKHAFYFSQHDEPAHRRMVLHYLNVAARVPVFELRAQSGLERLDELLDSLEQVMSPVTAVTP